MDSPRQWTMFAQLCESSIVGDYFDHFHMRENFLTKFHSGGPRTRLVHVQCTEEHFGEYYGWVRLVDILGRPLAAPTEPQMIRRGWNRFAIQFQPGIEEQQQQGKGRIVRLSVKEVIK